MTLEFTQIGETHEKEIQEVPNAQNQQTTHGSFLELRKLSLHISFSTHGVCHRLVNSDNASEGTKL